MKDLYLATYCYGAMKLSSREMAEKALELGFQGVEYLNPLTPEIAEVMEDTGIKVIDTSETAGEDGSVRNPDLLHKLGVRYVAGTSLVAFGNEQQTLWAAERLNRAGRQLARQGFKLFYHNHTHEWRWAGEKRLLEILLENTDPEAVCLQMDAGWAACAGADPVAFVKKYPGRVELMHVKASTGMLGPEGVAFMAPPEDGDGRGFMPPLQDDAPDGPPPAPAPEMQQAMERIRTVSGAMKDCIIDYKALMTAAEENGCKAFILERDEHYLDNPLDCIREDIAALRKFW